MNDFWKGFNEKVSEAHEEFKKSAEIGLVKFFKKVFSANTLNAFLNSVDGLFYRMIFECLLPKKYRGVSKKTLYEMLFCPDTKRGKRFDIWILVLIIINIVVLIVDSSMEHSSLSHSAEAKPFYYWLLRVLEWGFTIFFTFEYYLRIYCMKTPKKYIFSTFGVIDFFAIFPAYLSLLLPGAQGLSVLRLLRLLRIFRIFKMSRFIDEGHLLVTALRSSFVKILIYMIFVFILSVILGTVIFVVEGETNPMIGSIPKGIYWAVVTITTVGYGDIAPVTVAGRTISVLVMLLGYSIIAVPTGIVAGETLAARKDYKQNHGRFRKTEQDAPEGSRDYPDILEDSSTDSNDPYGGYDDRPSPNAI